MRRSPTTLVYCALLPALAIGLGYAPYSSAADPVTLPPGASNGLRLLEEMQTVITELAEATKLSVVSLFPVSTGGKGRESGLERMPNMPGTGAGVIITPEGHIITNNHVVGD